MKPMNFVATFCAVGLLSACSGEAGTAKKEQAAETLAPAADDDNDAAEPAAEASAEDHGHEHAEGEGEHSH